jgi:hypothetical protein
MAERPPAEKSLFEKYLVSQGESLEQFLRRSPSGGDLDESLTARCQTMLMSLPPQQSYEFIH